MNTPYFRGSNEENAFATSPLAPPPNTIHATPNRRVLGDVSTNPRVYSSPATGGLFSRKVMMGSPLKRTFTAAVEDGYGLKYLKRRRMSGEMGFGPVVEQKVRREDGGSGNGNGVGALRARSVPEGMATLPEPADEPLLYSPTEPNTPSDSGGETHDSFASLINFDPSSQHITSNHQSRHHQHEQEQQQQQQLPHFLHDNHAHLPPPPHFPPPQQHQQQQSSGLIFPTASHAETLKLRLQVAMYKIRTNQVNVPFAELQIEGEQQRNTEEQTARNRHRVSEAVEAAVATMRREAMDSMPRSTGPPPMLIPGPLLYPTAFSSRMIQQPDPVPLQQQQQQYQNQQFDLGPLAAAGLFMSDQQAQGGDLMGDM